MHPKNFPTSPLEPVQIESLVAPMLLWPLPPNAYFALAQYLELLYRWNQRLNLTAVRDPQVLAQLHLAECLRAAQRIPEGVNSVLDFGSGAGLPGIPIQIARPELRVTLAESQNKKASFLREAVRVLNLTRTTVHAGRVEDLPAGSTFDLVVLRAVDKMQQALVTASAHIRLSSPLHKGWCLVLTSRIEAESLQKEAIVCASQETDSRPIVDWLAPEAIPGTRQRVFLLGSRRW